MAKNDIKKKLKERIDHIEDESLLEEMLLLAEFDRENEEIYPLSESQLEAVKEAERQYKRGEFISGKQADKMIREWLEK